MNVLRNVSLTLVISIAASACHGGGAASADGGGPSSSGAAGELRASAVARWAEVSVPADASMLQAPAEVVAGPATGARVSMTHPGMVRRLAVRSGDRVEAGDLVCEIASPSLARAAADVAALGRQVDAAETRRKELVALEKKRLVGKSDVFAMTERTLQLRTELERARAELAAAGIGPRQQGRLRRDGVVELTAPIAGVVTDVHASVGGRVGAEFGPVVTLRGEGSSRVRANVQRTMPLAGRVVFAGVDGTTYALTKREDDTTIRELDDGTLRVWFDVVLGTGEELPPAGLRGVVRVEELGEDLREIPRVSLGLGADGPFVIRDGGDGVGERRAVEVVATNGTSAIVRGDLAVGDRVSTDPAVVLGGGEGS